MTIDPLVLMTDVEAATERLLHTAEGLDPLTVGKPSALPGWTVGHVLTHVARNADAYTTLLTGARTGDPDVSGYSSPQARIEGIENGAARPLREQIVDLREAHERFADAAAAMPAEAWTLFLSTTGQSAAAVPWSRLREVEVHHVDLGFSYSPADWTDAFALRLLREAVSGFDPAQLTVVLRPYGTDHPLLLGDNPDAPVVAGPTRSLAAWLTGRGDGGGDLTVSPDGELPVIPRWK